MSFLLLLVAIAMPSQAISAPNATVKNALVALQIEMTTFRTQAALIDAEFRELRQLLSRRRYQEALNLGADLQMKVRVTEGQWARLEGLLATMPPVNEGYLRRMSLPSGLVDADLATYIRIKRGGGSLRFDPTLLIRAWRGLEVGEKIPSIPQHLNGQGVGHAAWLQPGNLLLISTVNGGLIRGRLVGWTDADKMVLREALPTPFARLQSRFGPYRALDINETARLVVVQRAPTTVDFYTPPSALKLNGDYELGTIGSQVIYQIYLRPDDVQLLHLVQAGRWPDLEAAASIRMVDPRIERRPLFADPFFLNCEIGLLPKPDG